MSGLCKCIRLNAITPVVENLYGSEGTWTASGPKTGEFNVRHEGGPPCHGPVNKTQTSSVTLKLNGCGRLRFTVSGQGSRFWDYPFVSVTRLAPALLGIIAATGEGGFHPGCESSDLIHHMDHPGIAKVCCGQRILIQVHSLYNEGAPDLEVTVNVEVIE